MPSSTPPIAEKRPHPITTHGHTRIDDYYWMREKTSEHVLAYLNAENAYTEEMTADNKALEQVLYDEFIGRLQETDTTAPYQKGDYYYYSRTVEGLQYAIYCRKRGSLSADEEIVLDLNELGAKYDYLALGAYTISPNGHLLAYTLDTDGYENHTLYIKNLATGEHLPDVIEGVAWSVIWANDETIFYNRQNEAKRSDKLYRHQLGTTQAEDVLIMQEPDEIFSLYAYKTKDGQYIVLIHSSSETTECRVINTADPTAAPQLIHARETGLRYDIQHRKGTFYLTTNDGGARNLKVVTVSVENPAKQHWQTIVEHNPDIRIYNIELFDDFMVSHERENGLRQLRINQFSTGDEHLIQFDEAVYTISGGINYESTSSTLRFNYTSLTAPNSVFDYDMVTRDRTLVKQQPVLGGYDKAAYHAERLFATATDGAQIPISLIYRKDKWDGSAVPLHLYGYGSYGATIDPRFDSKLVSLLDRGVAYAIAHVRGSQIFGRKWYEDGKMLNKRNTFTDFIDSAKHLIELGYTTPEKLSAEGRSAGGLLMGAILNMAPNLFQTVIAGVPFVDVVTTMLDTSIPLTTGEFEEWGNPQDKEYYDYILSYSPYDNVEAKDYPTTLVLAGLNDPRVQYWEPSKWVAKLRDLKTDNNQLLFKVHMGAGHFSSSGRYDYYKDKAFEYAFLLKQHGLA